ncbi:prepilin-type N-terminal cleavage/methylation domain-containing protein [Flavobacteriaceae bacterium R38]|nr:prepilin-type N-terminal cleavage/methylation domain-containing protein [Flavobacteriaceae bacterium R38]
MKRITKIKAFTLNEMMVVLVITAIVVGLAFSILSLTQRQMLGMQQNYIKNDEMRRFEEALWVDFNKYREVSYNANLDLLTFKNEVDSTYYQFEETFVLKYQDTLNIFFEEKNFYLDGALVNEGYLDALEFTRSDAALNSTIFVFKKKDATHYMK